MSTKVEKTIEVDVPVRTAYDQWTQFEEFPQFMGGVQQVRQLDDSTTHWVAEIGGIRREWNARILEQVPDTKVAWAATEGATNAGAVYFTPLGAARTAVRLTLEYEPEGIVEKAGDALNVIERRAQADLEKFKSFIESRGSATGAWRGSVGEGTTVGTPGVESAAASRGDSGAAGVSPGKAVAGAAVVAGVAAAGIAAAKALSGNSEEEQQGTTGTAASAGSTTGSTTATGAEFGAPATTPVEAEPPLRSTAMAGAGGAGAAGGVDPVEAEAGLAGSPLLGTPGPDDDYLEEGEAAVVTNNDLRATDEQGRPL